MGYYQVECEARLALAELELKASSSLGRSLAKELAADAGDHNLQLIVRQAQVLAAGAGEIASASGRK